MTLRNVVLTAHILFALVTIGWFATHGMLLPAIIRRGSDSAGFLRVSVGLSKKVGPMSGLVLLLGLWLVFRDGNDGIDISDGWVGGAIAIYVVTAVIGAVFMGRAEQAALDKLSAGQRADDEARTMSILGGISMLLLVVIVYLMVAKPGGY